VSSLKHNWSRSYTISHHDEKALSKHASLDSDTKTSKLSNSKFYSSIYSVEPPDILSDLSLHTLPDYLVNGSCGVDRLVITIQLDPDSLVKDEFLSNIFGPENKTAGRVRLPHCPAMYVSWSDSNSQVMRIDFNPSNLSRLDGLELCPFFLLPYYTEKAIKSVIALGDLHARPLFLAEAPWHAVGPWPTDWMTHVNVYVLHLARDFLINDFRFSLEQLRGVKPSRARAVTLHCREGIVETATHPASKDRHRHQFYNKYEERQKVLASKKKDKAIFAEVPKGTYRYEVQIPRAALRKINWITLDVLTKERLLKSLKIYWQKSNYWTPLVWEGQHYVQTRKLLSEEDTAVLLLYLRNKQLGMPLEITRSEELRLQRLRRGVGLSASAPLRKQGKPYGALNLEAGALEILEPFTLTTLQDSVTVEE
jgi:hypothetical protein